MTITLTREEAQQVLDALNHVNVENRVRVIETLRARLSAPEQLGEIVPADEEQLKRIAKLVEPEPEPVAWMEKENYLDEDNLWETRTVLRDYDNGSGVPLYTSPPQRGYDKENDAVDALTEDGWTWDGDQWQRPPQREWQGLTEGEIMQLVKTWHGSITLASAIEAKLKEKNT